MTRERDNTRCQPRRSDRRAAELAGTELADTSYKPRTTRTGRLAAHTTTRLQTPPAPTPSHTHTHTHLAAIRLSLIPPTPICRRSRPFYTPLLWADFSHRLCLGHAQERRAGATKVGHLGRSKPSSQQVFSHTAATNRPGARKAKGRPTPIQSRSYTQCLRRNRPRAPWWCIAWRLRLGRWPQPRRRSCSSSTAS